MCNVYKLTHLGRRVVGRVMGRVVDGRPPVVGKVGKLVGRVVGRVVGQWWIGWWASGGWGGSAMLQCSHEIMQHYSNTEPQRYNNTALQEYAEHSYATFIKRHQRHITYEFCKTYIMYEKYANLYIGET